jgi:hypothetical protein
MGDEQRQPTPVYELPTEKEKYIDDPFGEQRAYFQYWEEVERQKRNQYRRNSRGLSVYEQAREKYPNSF